MNDRERAVELFEKQDAREIVGEGQGRERPLNVGAFLHFRRKAGVIADDKREAARIPRHVLPDEFRKLLRGPRFAFRIENHDAIGYFEGGQEFLLFHFRNFQWEKMFDASGVVFAKSGDMRTLDRKSVV